MGRIFQTEIKKSQQPVEKTTEGPRRAKLRRPLEEHLLSPTLRETLPNTQQTQRLRQTVVKLRTHLFASCQQTCETHQALLSWYLQQAGSQKRQENVIRPWSDKKNCTTMWTTLLDTTLVFGPYTG